MSRLILSRLQRNAVAGWLSLAAVAAIAAPPPPPLVPEALTRPVDGYDLQVPYQLWHHWVEAQKGAVTEALLAEPESIAGEQAYGAPLLRFAKRNDFGHFLTGEIQAYCRVTERGTAAAGSCHYRLRRAFVALDAADYEGDNPVARWTRESFDAARLVAHFRASGFSPESDWWRLDRARMFAVLPSSVPMLTEHATVVRLDSRDCPALGEAIAAVEPQRLDWRLDLIGVGVDGTSTAPPPHSILTAYTLRIRTPDGVANIEGEYGALDEIVGPILEAADNCERSEAGAGAAG